MGERGRGGGREGIEEMLFYFFQSFVGVVVFGCHVSLCWCVMCVCMYEVEG